MQLTPRGSQESVDRLDAQQLPYLENAFQVIGMEENALFFTNFPIALTAIMVPISYALKIQGYRVTTFYKRTY